MSCTGNKECSCGCETPYGGHPRVALTFGDGGHVSKRITDDIDRLVLEQFGGDKKLAERAKAMVNMMAYGGLTDKGSGSVDATVDPEAGLSTSAFDAGISKDDVEFYKRKEGTFGEELKDVGRFVAKTGLGAATGVIDAAGNMLGADINTSDAVRGMKLGERDEDEIKRRETAAGIASTTGALAATVVGGVLSGGNPTVISRGAEQTFTELGEINPENEALQTVSDIGEVGSQIYGTVAGGVQAVQDDPNLDLKEVTDDMTKEQKRQARGENIGNVLNQAVAGTGATGATGIPGISAAGGPISYKPMPHGGPHGQWEVVSEMLQNWDDTKGRRAMGEQLYGTIGSTEADLASEKEDVAAVRGNLMSTAEDMEAVNKRIMNATEDDPEAYAALQHFRKLRDYTNTVEETRELTRTAPALLKQMLPNYGQYNLKFLNPAKYDAGDELYCTPMGCDTYRRAGASDVPMVAGNLGFQQYAKTGKVGSTYFPFEQIPESQRELGDIATKTDLTLMDYRGDRSRYGSRPHHTVVYAGPGTQEGSIMSYQVDEGQRGHYGLKEEVLPTLESQLEYKQRLEDRGKRVSQFQTPHFDYYRYVGAVPQYEQELENRQAVFDHLFDQGFFNESMPQLEKIQLQPIEQNISQELQVPANPGNVNISTPKVPVKERIGMGLQTLFNPNIEKDSGGVIEYKKGGSYQGGLRRWFKEKWVDVKTGKPCGRSGKEKSTRGYPYCRPSKKVSSKTPATSKHSAAKSRAAQKTGPKRVKPIMRKRSKK